MGCYRKNQIFAELLLPLSILGHYIINTFIIEVIELDFNFDFKLNLLSFNRNFLNLLECRYDLYVTIVGTFYAFMVFVFSLYSIYSGIDEFFR